MSQIPDFSKSELWTIQSTLMERYGENDAPQIDLAETEMRLDKGSTQLVACPAAYWAYGKCHFLIIKTTDNRYRCQFFYRIHQIYGTGTEEYDDLAKCAVTLLQVQADHEANNEEQNT